jgi:acyl carrier protein
LDNIRGDVLDIINKFIPNIEELNENLFSTAINLQPIDMIYIILQISKKFNIKIDEKFIECIRDTSISNIIEAVANASKGC